MCGREGLIGGQGGGAGKKIIAGHRPKTDPKAGIAIYLLNSYSPDIKQSQRDIEL